MRLHAEDGTPPYSAKTPWRRPLGQSWLSRAAVGSRSLRAKLVCGGSRVSRAGICSMVDQAPGRSGAGADEDLGLAGAVASGHESIIVLDSTQDRQSHQPTGLSWRLAQLRIGVGDPVDRLRWTVPSVRRPWLSRPTWWASPASARPVNSPAASYGSSESSSAEHYGGREVPLGQDLELLRGRVSEEGTGKPCEGQQDCRHEDGPSPGRVLS